MSFCAVRRVKYTCEATIGNLFLLLMIYQSLGGVANVAFSKIIMKRRHLLCLGKSSPSHQFWRSQLLDSSQSLEPDFPATLCKRSNLAIRPSGFLGSHTQTVYGLEWQNESTASHPLPHSRHLFLWEKKFFTHHPTHLPHKATQIVSLFTLVSPRIPGNIGKPSRSRPLIKRRDGWHPCCWCRCCVSIHCLEVGPPCFLSHKEMRFLFREVV